MRHSNKIRDRRVECTVACITLMHSFLSWFAWMGSRVKNVLTLDRALFHTIGFDLLCDFGVLFLTFSKSGDRILL